jgi:hypothetical protein
LDIPERKYLDVPEIRHSIAIPVIGGVVHLYVNTCEGIAAIVGRCYCKGDFVAYCVRLFASEFISNYKVQVIIY